MQVTGTFRRSGKQIDGQEVHGVHQEDPEEHREGDGATNLGIRRYGRCPGLIGDHLDEDLDGSLEAARDTEVALLAAFISNQQRDDAEADREEEGVQVPHSSR